MMSLKGFRIWEIDDKTKVPKKLHEGDIESFMLAFEKDLDLENKTYAIRIGKKGLS